MQFEWPLVTYVLCTIVFLLNVATLFNFVDHLQAADVYVSLLLTDQVGLLCENLYVFVFKFDIY